MTASSGKEATEVLVVAKAQMIPRGTPREDLDDNATLYDKRLENSDMGVRPPKAAAKLLELLNRYSTKERKN